MKILASALFAAGLLGMASTAQALPAAPIVDAPHAITDVGWRCGPGWHINRWGQCVPNRRVYRPYRYWGPPRFHRHHHHHHHWRHHHFRGHHHHHRGYRL